MAKEQDDSKEILKLLADIERINLKKEELHEKKVDALEKRNANLVKENKLQDQRIAKIEGEAKNKEEEKPFGGVHLMSRQGIGMALARLPAPLEKVISGIRDAIITGFAEGDQLQARAIGINSNLTKVMETAGMDLQALPGGIEHAVEAALTAQEMGLGNLDKNTADLAQRMRLTGQDNKHLLKVLRGTQIALRGNKEQTASLALSLEETSTKYGIQTTRLLNTLGALEETLGALSLVNKALPANLAKAVANVQGMVGAEAGPLVTKFVQEIFAPGGGPLAQASILGALPERLAAMQGSTEGLIALIKKMGEGSTALGGQFSGLDPSLFREIMEGLVGPAGLRASQLNNQITLLEEGNAIQQSYLGTLKTFNEQVFEPVAGFIMRNMSAGLVWITKNYTTLRNLLVVAGLTLAVQRAIAMKEAGKSLFQVGVLGALAKMHPIVKAVSLIATVLALYLGIKNDRESQKEVEESRNKSDMKSAFNINDSLRINTDKLNQMVDALVFMTGDKMDKLLAISEDNLTAVYAIAGASIEANALIERQGRGDK